MGGGAARVQGLTGAILQAASDASRCSQDAASSSKVGFYAAAELGPRSFISTFYPDTLSLYAGARHYAASVPARELSSSALWRDALTRSFL